MRYLINEYNQKMFQVQELVSNVFVLFFGHARAYIVKKTQQHWANLNTFFTINIKMDLTFLSEVLTIYFPPLDRATAAADSLFETKIGFADLDLLLLPAI